MSSKKDTTGSVYRSLKLWGLLLLRAEIIPFAVLDHFAHV